ncbi:chemotaxis protein [Colwellia sp. Bg11-28]|uniref:chemotaxis protein n=1 Tax=Colwellia sp. Bg11-28 TaxID=2058305 RepID=UPI000C33DAB9|nr:chemotaxis protein [Colwellia sp. Bg11-28]PKH85411.1 chemotaxis protein [Colwellia sp. Bg11-28]
MNQFHLTEDQQDCLRELINIAMGQASDQLARYLDTFVYLKVPSIESVEAKDLMKTLSQQKNTVAVVSQGFFGYEGIRGEALLVYKEENSGRIADLLGYEPDELSQDEQLIDISSILTTTFLNVFAQQINNQLSYNAPKLLPNVQEILSEHLQQMPFTWDLALKVNINYQVTDYSFNCNMILLIPETAITNIKHVLDRILEEF